MFTLLEKMHFMPSDLVPLKEKDSIYEKICLKLKMKNSMKNKKGYAFTASTHFITRTLSETGSANTSITHMRNRYETRKISTEESSGICKM